MPYVYSDGHHSDARVEKFVTISDGSLARNYEFIGMADSRTGIDEISLYLIKDPYAMLIRGVVPVINEYGEPTNEIVFGLKFKRRMTTKLPTNMDEERCRQVDSVFIHPSYRGAGISANVYKELVRRGFIIISDSAQFPDGKYLWKKLIRQRDELSVFVLDSDGAFLTDASGNPVMADDVDDSRIWSEGEDYSGTYRLLVMRE